MTKPAAPKPKPVHAVHVLEDGRAHLHWCTTASTIEVQRAGDAARAFLGNDRRAPSGIAPGFYLFRVADDGNGYIGRRADHVKPA